jgi:hypothetical protein
MGVPSISLPPISHSHHDPSSHHILSLYHSSSFHSSISAQGSGPCNPGRWCPAGSTGALGVSGCPVGFYCANGADRQQCRAGSFCPPNAAQPVPCPSGRFCQTNGLSTVTGTCPGGYFCSTGSVQSMLSGCSPGFYCPAGSSTASGNGTCPRGYYCPPQSAEPIVCEKGNVCGDNAMSQPDPCPGGFFCPSTGLSAATPCPGGFYCAKAADGSSPDAYTGTCQAGHYCPAKSTSPTQNVCRSGHFCPSHSANMIPCPAGKFCAGTGLSTTTGGMCASWPIACTMRLFLKFASRRGRYLCEI